MSDDFIASQPPPRVAELMQFSANGALLMGQLQQAQSALKALQAAGYWCDAMAYIAYCLPRHYVPVWICQCMRDQPARDEPTRMADAAAVALAERWIRQPTEANRQAALDFATRAGFQTVGDWLAASVGWADGSLSPAPLPVVAPAAHLPALAAKAALGLLSARAGNDAKSQQAHYIATAHRMFKG